MDIRSFLLAVGSVALGWLLSELSQVLRARGERKRALGRALTELLELRHYLRAIDVVFSEIRKRWPIPASELHKGLQYFDRVLPPDPGLPSRLDRAISDIAAIHPLLAFSLRSKERIPFFLARLRAVRLPQLADNATLVEIDQLVRTSVTGALEASIRSLAWRRGILSWLSIRRHLRRRDELPSEVEKLFSLGTSLPNVTAGGA
jgi:hypothetical protein